MNFNQKVGHNLEVMLRFLAVQKSEKLTFFQSLQKFELYFNLALLNYSNMTKLKSGTLPEVIAKYGFPITD